MIIWLLFLAFRRWNLEAHYEQLRHNFDQGLIHISPRLYLARLSFLALYILPGIVLTIVTVLFLNWFPRQLTIFPEHIQLFIRTIFSVIVSGILIADIGYYTKRYNDLLITQRWTKNTGFTDHFSKHVQLGPGYLYFLVAALILSLPILFAFAHETELPQNGRVLLFLTNSTYISIFLSVFYFHSKGEGFFGNAAFAALFYAGSLSYFLLAQIVDSSPIIEIFLICGTLLCVFFFYRNAKFVRRQLKENVVDSAHAGAWKRLLFLIPLICMFSTMIWLRFFADQLPTCTPITARQPLIDCAFQDYRILFFPLSGMLGVILASPYINRLGALVGNFPTRLSD